MKLDVLECPECHTEAAVEHLFKAIAENPAGDERAIWAPHENPFLTAHVEDVTGRLSAILERIMDALARLLTGEPLGMLGKALSPWQRWSPERLDQVREQLEAKPPESYTLADWMMVCDYLIQRYLPDGVIQDEAEYLTVRATILGKIQAAHNEPEPPPPDILEAWATLTPTHFAQVPPRALSATELGVMHVAKERSALHIGNVSEAARARMKELVIEHVQAQLLGQREGTSKHLATRLFDEFATLNRDFRRIAVTEAGECALQGFIAARPFGSRVIRREAYRNACKFCRSIDGRVFTVVDPAKSDKDGETEVWTGKSNVGRAAALRKREGALLTERAPHERWWPAAGVQHPSCRGVWLAAPDAPVGASPEFLKLMAEMVAEHRAGLAQPA